MQVVRLTLAALGLAAALTGAAVGARPASGLHGVVMRGPTKPVCETDSCDEPAVGVLVRFSQAGIVVVQVKTGTGGRYSVRLRPGAYAVTTPHRVGTGLTPRLVRVPTGRLARLDFHLDTGIQ